MTFIIASSIFASITFAGLAVQMLQTRRLISKLQRSLDNAENTEEVNRFPPAAILLSLRGGDPFLREGLDRLARQDYPDYQIFIMIDHPQDPACEIVESFIQQTSTKDITIKYLSDRNATCTLLNQSYAALVESLDERFEYVVTVDADAVTWPSWLRNLVKPLADESVGGTTGNRWYLPKRTTVGSLMRFVWNANAVIQMADHSYPWGGSLAVRADLARHPEMLARWRKACSADSILCQFVKDSGKKFVFNPDVMVINAESISIGSLVRWVSRQMMNVRLYIANWKPVLIHGIGTSIFLVAAIVLNLSNFIYGQWTALVILSVPLMLFWFAIYAASLKIDQLVVRAAKSRGQQVDRMSIWASIKMFMVTPFVQLLYLFAILKSYTIKHIFWRGIKYQIRGPFDVQLMEYKPFQTSKNADALQSL